MSSLLYPTGADPLPLYTPRQNVAATRLETSSIQSIAPSYTSDVPSYHSSLSRRGSAADVVSESVEEPMPPVTSPAADTTLPSPTPPTPTGLPRLEFAPGFRRRRSSQFRPDGWLRRSTEEAYPARTESNTATSTRASSNPSSSHRSPRPYTNKPTKGHRVLSLSIGPSHPNLRPPPPHPPTPPSSVPNPRASESSYIHLPEEDPLLVGHEAAAEARQRRLYIASVRRGFTDEETDAMRRHEAKTWDFMLTQMADWDERERSWNRWKNDFGRSERRPRILGGRGGGVQREGRK